MQPNIAAGERRGVTAAAAPTLSEDCLYLNVWTEAASASERRPVIVWSHGGAFTISGMERDGEALARKGAVVITYNYRLGPFGFFSHPELTRESGRNASGNYGLMDLFAVLRWVRRNIASFGGDPNRVTLMGQSAGGRLTRAAVASSQGKRLFHRVISQSAPARIERMLTRADAEKAGQPNRGATHGAEGPYVFNSPPALWTDVDRALADAMSSYWVNFATKGDPNGAGLPVWPALQPTAHERLILGPKIELGPALDARRVALFDAVAIRRSVAPTTR